MARRSSHQAHWLLAGGDGGAGVAAILPTTGIVVVAGGEVPARLRISAPGAMETATTPLVKFAPDGSAVIW